MFIFLMLTSTILRRTRSMALRGSNYCFIAWFNPPMTSESLLQLQTSSCGSNDVKRRTMATSPSCTTDDENEQQQENTRYVITNEEIDRMEGTRKVHFLNPNAKRINKSLGDLTGLCNIGFHIIEIPPGCDSTELHKHYHEEECVYVLAGEAIATIGYHEDKDDDGNNNNNDTSSPTESNSSIGKIHVKAGDFIGYRLGKESLPHKLTNVGQTTLKCIVVGQRLDNDIADYPSKNLRLFRSSNSKELGEWNLVSMDFIKVPSNSNAGKK